MAGQFTVSDIDERRLRVQECNVAQAVQRQEVGELGISQQL